MLKIGRDDKLKPIEQYLNKKSWRVNENANRIYAYGGLKSYLAEKEISSYLLNDVYPKDLSVYHKKGYIHIHDLSSGLVPYCCGHSLYTLISEGFNRVPSTVQSKPAKHFRSVLGQLMNYLGVLQQEWAGAQSVNSFDTLLAPFIHYDDIKYDEVKQGIQEFIFNINVPLRFGMEVPFTNISFDLVPPSDLVNDAVVIGGELQKDTYGDFQDEMDIINEAFLEVMYDGDAKGNPFPFPIPTYSITREFNFESNVGYNIAKLASKYGSPYFQNCISGGIDPSDTRSMCCRLRLDLKELRRKTGGLFGNGDNTGSLNVVTINLNRIGYLAKDEDKYFEYLDELLQAARRIHLIKKDLINNSLNIGLLPYTKRYIGNFDTFFCTFGVIGGNESCINFMNQDIGQPEAKKFMIKVLNHIKEVIREFQSEDNQLYNLEETPAEGASYRLAYIDKKECSDIFTSGTKTSPYLTNSTHLPVNYTNDLWYTLKHQEELQEIYTGGTVTHLFIGEKSVNPTPIKSLIRRVAESSKIPYYTITPTYSVCPNHGYISGEHHECPNCGSECDVYSRIVGYYRPLKQWNIGKQKEFQDRVLFKVEQ